MYRADGQTTVLFLFLLPSRIAQRNIRIVLRFVYIQFVLLGTCSIAAGRKDPGRYFGKNLFPISLVITTSVSLFFPLSFLFLMRYLHNYVSVSVPR